MKQRSREASGSLTTDGFKELILRVPTAIGEALKCKVACYVDSNRMREQYFPLPWNESSARTVIADIEELLRGGVKYRLIDKEDFTASDLKLAEEIVEATVRAGISNITRTEAYLECYRACPELHWAFLAHLVSRNTGWYMTDLCSWMATNIDAEEKRNTYRFLERNNALIFQDAYPQLLLYKKCRELGTSRFHLLPYFHVSSFMRPFWERFWIDRESALLTVGLIINEQNYIEKRVVRQPFFRKYVMGKMNYRLFNLAGLNQVVFPLMEGESAPGGTGGEVRRLAGRVVTNFGSLSSRIAIGKSLYAMLMGLRAVRSGAERFAASVPHSGSRADYWPCLFTANQEEALPPTREGAELLRGETLPAGQRLYSPKLLDAWGDTPYEPIPREDWLSDHRALNAISAPQAPFLCDISREHRNGILKTAMLHDALQKD